MELSRKLMFFFFDVELTVNENLSFLCFLILIWQFNLLFFIGWLLEVWIKLCHDNFKTEE